MSSRRLSTGLKAISATDRYRHSALAPGVRLYIADLVYAGGVSRVEPWHETAISDQVKCQPKFGQMLRCPNWVLTGYKFRGMNLWFRGVKQTSTQNAGMSLSSQKLLSTHLTYDPAATWALCQLDMLLSALGFNMNGNVARLKSLLEKFLNPVGDLVRFHCRQARIDRDNHVNCRVRA